MKRPTMLFKALLAQASLDLDLSVERDAQRIEHRCKHEGLSFLTITLPKLSDALEKGLEDGLLTCPTDFSCHGRLPRLLGGFFSRVFARNGELLERPDVECIYYIRQICRFFKKLKMNCSPAREQEAIRQFIRVEDELRMMTGSITRKDDTLDKVSRVLWSQVFPGIDNCDLVCHHGPGVTADRRLPNERHTIRYWYDRWEYTFPADLHAYPNYEYACEGSREGGGTPGLEYLDVRQEPSVRVVFVPKTLTTPRVIAIEPSSMQFVQQSLKDYIVPILESHELTKRSIRFSDQTVNQSLAHKASISRRLATLDLKEASDRVHYRLVRRIFQATPLLEYLEDARSLHATLPNGENRVLWKYASMGSALCFPVEAMVFYTLIQSAFHDHYGIRPSAVSIKRFSRDIDIYGDDIIVPVELTDAVMGYLESFGLKVNVNKSFRFSLFRESCGGDYYEGTDVKPVYARELPPSKPSQWQANQVMSWASTADQFYERGKWLIAQAIRDMLESDLRTSIPRSVEKRAGLAFASKMFNTKLRYDAHLCAYSQKRIVYQPLKQKDDIDGNAIACLNKWGYSLRVNDRLASRSRSTGRRYVSTEGSIPFQSGRPDSDIRNVVPLPENSEEQRFSTYGLSEVLLDSGDTSTLFSDSRSEGLAFGESVKRGVFKSKRQWVTIVS